MQVELSMTILSAQRRTTGPVVMHKKLYFAMTFTSKLSRFRILQTTLSMNRTADSTRSNQMNIDKLLQSFDSLCAIHVSCLYFPF
jgi:hypothetical protein